MPDRPVLLIDNYDSFVHNLARYFERLGQATCVIRNTAIDVPGVAALAPAALVLSPGPCTPQEAGVSLELVRQLHASVPILGICLGHQTLAAAFGANIVRAREPVHGRSSPILHDGREEFAGLPNPMHAARYHSLVVDESTLPGELHVSARTEDGTVMALRHVCLPLVGLQFHPESILTDCGYAILAQFLARCGLRTPDPLPTITEERIAATRG